jgi:hypothetical protein
MTLRLSIGAFVFLAAACTAAPKPAEEAQGWACRDTVREAVSYAYAMAKHRDDQRAVMLFPAGPAMAAYEAETKRLRDEGARLLAALKQHDPAASSLAPLAPPPVAGLSEALIEEKILNADACMNAEPEALSACGRSLTEGQAYVRQHAATRVRRMEVMRFASEAAMNAYVERTDYFQAAATDLAGMRTLIAYRYNLAMAGSEPVFAETSDEEADRRIADARTCAAPLVR